MNLERNESKEYNKHSNENFTILKYNYIYFLATIRSFFKNKNFLKHFGFIYLLYFIGIFGLLIADVYHRDDIWRSQGGLPALSHTSRHLSQNLSYFFHASYPKIADISPLSQLIAIAFLSIASMALVKIVNKKVTYIGLVASLLLGLNPWYLQCISYKYDSMFMTLATLCAIFPFLFRKKLDLFFIISVFLLVCMWNLYQTNNGIYLIIALFILLNLVLSKSELKNIIKFIFYSAFAFILALLIYKFIFIVPNTAGSDIDSLFIFIDNGKKLLNLLNDNLGTHILKPLFLISMIFFAIAMLQRRKTNSIISSLLILGFLVIGLFVSYGIYIFLSNFFSQARGISQIGGFLAIIAIGTVSQKKKILIFMSKCVVIYMSYCLITISNAYANALDAQEKFDQYRINLMLKDLQHLLPINTKERAKIFINGARQREPYIGIYRELLPLMSNLTAQISNHSVYQLRQRGLDVSKSTCKKNNEKAKKIIETRFHKIEVFENNCYEITYK